MKNHRNALRLGIIFCAILMAQPVLGQNIVRNPLMDFEPTAEQITALQDIFDEFSVMQLKLRGAVDVKYAELKLELMKKDRFETKAKDLLTKRQKDKLFQAMLTMPLQ